jgi:hypothetical protein
MRRNFAQALILIGALTVIIWLLNRLVIFMLPDALSRNILLIVGVFVAITGIISSFKDIIDLFHIVAGKQPSKELSGVKSSLPFLNRVISTYMNTRTVRLYDNKTTKLFGGSLYISGIAIYSNGISFILGSPGYNNKKIEMAKIGDSFIYMSDQVYDVRFAEYIGDFYRSAKLIVTRSPVGYKRSLRKSVPEKSKV